FCLRLMPVGAKWRRRPARGRALSAQKQGMAAGVALAVLFGAPVEAQNTVEPRLLEARSLVVVSAEVVAVESIVLAPEGAEAPAPFLLLALSPLQFGDEGPLIDGNQERRTYTVAFRDIAEGISCGGSPCLPTTQPFSVGQTISVALGSADG